MIFDGARKRDRFASKLPSGMCASRRWVEKSVKLQVEAPDRVGQENCTDTAANVEFSFTLVLGPKVFLGHEFSVFCLNLKDG